MTERGPQRWTRFRIAACTLGPVLGAAAGAWLHPEYGGGSELSAQGACVVGLLVWMAIWWATEAVELAVTGMLPIVACPLAGIATSEQVLPAYANDVIFLFAGGCVIGLAIERHGLGERCAAIVLSRAGRSPSGVIAGFMLVTAVISAWVSNTASAAMMMPLAAAAIASVAAANQPARSSAGADRGGDALPSPLQQFQRATLLAVAYGASIGGVMTVLGSPPNATAAEWIRQSGGQMDFVRWSTIGAPLGVAMMIASVIAFRVLFPCRGLTMPERGSMSMGSAGKLTQGAWITLAVFIAAVAAWVAAPWAGALVPGLKAKDGQIAVAAALLLLALPGGRQDGEPVVPWSAVSRLPFGVFILFGGGLALADAMQRTGVSAAIAGSLTGVAAMPEPLVIGAVVIVLIFASEIASNTALAATAVPIVGAMAPGLGIPPERLVVAAALGASYAFMLPVGTPPNAIVYGTGLVPVRTMMRSGLVLNLLAAVLITAACMLLC